MTTRPTQTRLRLLIALIAMVAALGLSACGADAGDISRFADASRPIAYANEQIGQAEYLLITHDIEGARRSYATSLEQGDPLTLGTAAAGKALTDLFLIGDSPGVRKLLVNELAATNEGYSTQQLLWSDRGILYWLSLGTPWQAESGFEGVQTILADQLPWSTERLASSDAFWRAVDSSGDDISIRLLEVADELRGIETNLQIALDDPKFEYFYVPADVFHDQSLSFALGKSDLAALHAVLSMARGALNLFAAYEHTWVIADALAEEQTDEERFYTYVDPLLARGFARQVRLTNARRAFEDGLFFAAESITLGLEEEGSQISFLDWSLIDRDLARQQRDILNALANALSGPTKVPHFEPDFTLDLSSFFDGSRTLSAEIPWFVELTDDLDGVTSWEVNDDAIQAFFLDGVFDPPASVQEDYPSTPTFDEQALDDAIEALLSNTSRRLEFVYGVSLVSTSSE